MEGLVDHVFLSRLQFAFTAMFHILWPVITIGLSIFLSIAEVLWLKTRDEIYYRQARFWSRLFILNFGDLPVCSAFLSANISILMMRKSL